MEEPTLEDLAQELLDRKVARRSLLGFTEYTHPNFQPGEHHRLIAEFLERMHRDEFRRGLITAPPRHGKSEMASRRFPAWYLGQRPTHQIITTTYSSDFAADFGQDVRDIVNSSRYQNVFPGVGLRADSKAKGKWRTTEGGIYIATGVGGPITGRGAQLAIIDDPFKNRQDADSFRRRETIWDWYTSTFRTRLMPGGKILVIMTRWHEDDLAGRLMNDSSDQSGEHFEHLDLQALIGENTDDERALWPEWYPREELHKTRAVLNRRNLRDWSALYQQRPIDEKGDYYQREWFKRYDENDYLPPMRVYISADYAVTHGNGDFTEIGVFGLTQDEDVYILDWESMQATADTWIDALLDLCAKWNPYEILGEKGVIRKAVEPFIIKRMNERRIWPVLVWTESIVDKPTKGQSFRGRCHAGKVHVPMRATWVTEWIRQMVAFPAGRYDDKHDTCANFGQRISEMFGAAKEIGEAPSKSVLFDYGQGRRDDDTASWRVQ